MTTYTGASYSTTIFSGVPTGAQVSAFYTAIYDALNAVGLVQTADTGQLNPASTTWPGTVNTEAGYYIYRFNDAQQGTDPIFLKVSLRKGSNNGKMEVWVQVGQGSNGSGTLTGSTTDMVNTSAYYNTSNTGTTTVQTYACAIDGVFWLVYGYNNPVYRCAQGFLVVERTRDPTTGAFDAAGVVLAHRGDAGAVAIQSAFVQSLKWTGPVKSLDSSSVCIVPGMPTSTALTNGDKQIYPWWYDLQGVRQMCSVGTILQSEVGVAPTTFTATPYKTTSRTMITLGVAGNGNPLTVSAAGAGAYGDTTFGAAFVWE